MHVALTGAIDRATARMQNVRSDATVAGGSGIGASSTRRHSGRRCGYPALFMNGTPSPRVWRDTAVLASVRARDGAPAAHTDVFTAVAKTAVSCRARPPPPPERS